MTFSDTVMMELGITQSANIHNTRSLIRTLKYVWDILQTEEAFTVNINNKNTHTHTHTHARKDSSIYLKIRNLNLSYVIINA